MTKSLRHTVFALAAPLAFAQQAPAAAPSAKDVDFFETRIRPVLAAKCFQCHSDRAQKLKGGLRLDSRAHLLKGGDSGPALIPGDPDHSQLILAIRGRDPDILMPPATSGERLADDVVADFEKWVKSGAAFPDKPAGADKPAHAWWELIPANKLQPASLTVEKAVDHYIGAKLKSARAKPASATPDAALARRLTLDLAGRIPTAAEAREFADSKARDKRAQLVDRLMASPGFARHLVHELDWLLMSGERADLRGYLAPAVEEKRPWDRVFRELIAARDTEAKGSSAFLRARVRDPDKMVTDVSVRFFGVDISCAQCHDHPLVPSWKQDHYFGMKSFFSRTFDFGDFVAEREYGAAVTFKTTKGESKDAKLMFLTGRVVEEPAPAEPTAEQKRAEKQMMEDLKKKKEPWPEPKFSRRAKLVEAGLAPGDEGFFARSIVNRVWAQLFGRGLVAPADQMHGANTPSHPELLAWLARDFSAHGYDLRRLVRGLVLSDAYARASAWGDSHRPDAALFAVAQPRALTPQQLALSLQVAATDPEALRDADQSQRQFKSLEGVSQNWVALFERSDEGFQLSVDEALMLSNHERVARDLLSDGSGRLIARLVAIQGPAEAVKLAYWTTLSRAPTRDEAEAVAGFISRRADRPADAWRHVVWSLMTGAEFRFNH
jgi:hypothetical protein